MKNEKNTDSRMKLEGDLHQIILSGAIDPSRVDWFSSLGFSALAAQTAVGSITILTGRITDQAHLRGLLNKLWDLNFEILQVKRVNAMKIMGEQSNEKDDPNF